MNNFNEVANRFAATTGADIQHWLKQMVENMSLERIRIELQIIRDRQEFWGDRGWVHWFKQFR